MKRQERKGKGKGKERKGKDRKYEKGEKRRGQLNKKWEEACVREKTRKEGEINCGRRQRR